MEGLNTLSLYARLYVISVQAFLANKRHVC